MKRPIKLVSSIVLTAACACQAMAADPIKIALVHGLSGSTYEVFSKQTHTGFEMGLEYATNGSLQVQGRDIEIIKKDTQFKPDVARAVLAEAYGDDDVVIIQLETII